MTYSVHDRGPNGDSETALSRKLSRKLSRVQKTPNWPSWAPQAHPGCTSGRVVGVSWLGAGRVAGCPSTVSWPAWPYCRCKAAHLTGRVLGWLCCIATQPSLSSLGLSQYNCFVLRYRFPPSQSCLLQYTRVYCNTKPSPFSHNTVSVLRHSLS